MDAKCSNKAQSIPTAIDARSFWDYSLKVYGFEGVAGAMLELQDRHGASVNSLLLACFLTEKGLAWTKADCGRVERAVDAWRKALLQPLRALRRNFGQSQLRQGAESVYEQLKAVELESERWEQAHMLESLELSGLQASDGDWNALLQANLNQYWAWLGSDVPDALAPLIRLLLDRCHKIQA